jgi:branched-chain amino acid transport system substrate-binding protein
MVRLAHSLFLFHAIVCLSVAPSAFAQDQSSRTAGAKLKVGVILALSGEGAPPGTSLQNGMTLALGKLKKEDRETIELIFEDDQMIPKNAVDAFTKLLVADEVQAVVNFSSATASALGPIAERKQVPLIAIASDPSICRDKKYVMNFLVMPGAETKVIVPEAIKRGYKRIARITTIHQGMLALKETFDEASKGRIEVVLDEEYPHDIKDFKPFITKLKSMSDVDAVLLTLMTGQNGLCARQLRELGVSQPMFGYHTIENAAEVGLSQGALVGTWYANPDSPNDEFVRDYTAAYPGASMIIAANGYDLVFMLLQASKSGVNPQAINEALHKVKNFSGALGTYSAATDNSFTLPAVVKIVRENGFEKVQAD